VEVVTNRPSDIKSQLLIASEKTGFDLAQKFAQYNGQILTAEILAKIVAEGVGTFMEKWFEGLRSQDLSGLIEIVLEGQNHKMTPAEMLGFVHALPISVIEKIVATAIGSGTGIHALMALEKHRRTGGGPTYVIETISGQVMVRFDHPGRGEVQFSLYDTFNLLSQDGQPLSP
jgi:hypothetical protein